MAAVNSQYNASSGGDDVPVKPVAFTGSNGKIPTLVDYNAFASSGTTLAIANKPPLLGDRKIQLPNIPVDIDWNLSSNQGATLCIKNKPDLTVTPTSFFDIPANPFQEIAPNLNGAKTGVMTCDGVTTLNHLTSFTYATFYGDVRIDGGLSRIKDNNLPPTPLFASVAGTGSYTDLVNKPTYATVASTGSYNDLLNRPTIPARPMFYTGTIFGAPSGQTYLLTFPVAFSDIPTIIATVKNQSRANATQDGLTWRVLALNQTTTKVNIQVDAISHDLDPIDPSVRCDFSYWIIESNPIPNGNVSVTATI